MRTSRELYLTCHLPMVRSNDYVQSSTHPRHGLSVVPVHFSWRLFGRTSRRCRLANLQPYPGWRSVLASQGDQPFQRRPIEGDMHVYAARGVSSLQTGPLVVDGTMYFTTDEGSYAINASTCEEKWKQHRHSDTPSMLLVNRGFA